MRVTQDDERSVDNKRALLTVHTGVQQCCPCSLYILQCGGHTDLHGHYTDRGYS